MTSDRRMSELHYKALGFSLPVPTFSAINMTTYGLFLALGCHILSFRETKETNVARGSLRRVVTSDLSGAFSFVYTPDSLTLKRIIIKWEFSVSP